MIKKVNNCDSKKEKEKKTNRKRIEHTGGEKFGKEKTHDVVVVETPKPRKNTTVILTKNLGNTIIPCGDN